MESGRRDREKELLRCLALPSLLHDTSKFRPQHFSNAVGKYSRRKGTAKSDRTLFHIQLLCLLSIVLPVIQMAITIFDVIVFGDKEKTLQGTIEKGFAKLKEELLRECASKIWALVAWQKIHLVLLHLRARARAL